jgi:acid phosphatase family membrane protein YuiD
MKYQLPISYSLVAAMIVQVLCQLTKFVFYSLKDKALTFKYLFTAGGMPSSHSAFVTALTVSIGLRNGISSELFAAAFVFSVIIIYDAYRLRGTVQGHSRIIAKLQSLLPKKDRENVEMMVGHTIPEIAAGIIVGAIFAIAVFFLIGRFS